MWLIRLQVFVFVKIESGMLIGCGTERDESRIKNTLTFWELVDQKVFFLENSISAADWR